MHLLHELAHEDLIQAPQYVIDSWKNIFTVLSKEPAFASPQSVQDFCKRVKPSSGVLDLLKAQPTNNGEREALGYLKRYVRGLEGELLCKFLRFCTGASMLCVPSIDVTFTRLDGFTRRIILPTQVVRS